MTKHELKAQLRRLNEVIVQLEQDKAFLLKMNSGLKDIIIKISPEVHELKNEIQPLKNNVHTNTKEITSINKTIDNIIRKVYEKK